ncbi:nucleotidyl transferase AbiEii/AbiGii toxin family protein [Treponema socranskii]
MTNSEKNSTSYSDYYEENLYGLQNGVLNIVKNLDVPFYLTGGTALSRGYYHHRYSDDLDFFVNCDAAFAAHTESVLADLKKNGYTWDSEIDFIKTVDFYSVTVHHSDFDCKLKIDFVNDVPSHFGAIVATDFFYRTDSVRNILSNKITAVFRFAGKDIADIYEICRHEHFNWGDVFKEVREKEVGIEPVEVSEIISGLPEKEFNNIKWMKRYAFSSFKNGIERIAKDMLALRDNTLP